MNKRKFFGTILGIIFWSVCIVFFTFAYYEWKSTDTNITLAIQDLSVECLPGSDINVTNIGPVLNYQDGVKSEFTINNESSQEMAIDLRLDITYISSNLLTKSFKYAVVTDTTGNTNYDYNNPVIMGSFTNFMVGSNILTTALPVEAETEQNFLFVVYIDGNMKNDTNMQDNSLEANLMIGNCEEDVTPLDELVYQAIYSETDNSLTFLHIEPLSVGDTYNEKLVTKVYTGFETANYSSPSVVPWYSDGNYTNITTVKFDSIIKPKSTAYWFYGLSNLTSINLDKLDTSNVTTMYYMFYGCSSLASIDVSSFDTSKVTNMSYMFNGCSSLTSLDLNTFNTSNVTNMYQLFYNCSSLVNVNVSGFNTSKVTDMTGMFANCNSLVSLDVSNFNTSNVTKMGGYFSYAGGMFQNCSSLTSLDVSNFDTSKVTDMQYLFYKCNNLVTLDLSSFDTSSVTSMSAMFNGCSSLLELDVSNFDTGNATNMNSMFYGCSSLTSLDLSNFDTSNVTDLAYMFNSCSSLTSLDVSNFNTSKVTGMTGMFNSCSSLTSLDLSNFDTSNVTNMGGMFWKCNNLINLKLDLTKFNTSNVTNMNYMFHGCNNLTTTITISNLNSTTYTNMFTYTANQGDALVTVNYTSATSSLVDDMVGNQHAGNVIKGTCIGDGCPA